MKSMAVFPGFDNTETRFWFTLAKFAKISCITKIISPQKFHCFQYNLCPKDCRSDIFESLTKTENEVIFLLLIDLFVMGAILNIMI